jgi:hypothetical protein
MHQAANNTYNAIPMPKESLSMTRPIEWLTGPL